MKQALAGLSVPNRKPFAGEVSITRRNIQQQGRASPTIQPGLPPCPVFKGMGFRKGGTFVVPKANSATALSPPVAT